MELFTRLFGSLLVFIYHCFDRIVIHGYAVVISGELDMVLDDTTVHLRAGDILVQRGTIHNWINHGTEPCVIAFALIGAKPVTINGRALDGHG